jgi:hypothetical protein
MTETAATPEPVPSQPPGMKACAKCGESKPLVAFPGRQNTCIACRDAAKARTAERKDAVAWSPELGERITDMVAAGMTIAEVCALAAMPTARQMKAWRRTNPEFDAAMETAELQSAAVHLDAAKQVLRQVESGKLPAPDGKMLFDGHMRLASTLNPRRYGSQATVDVTSAGRPLIDLGSAIKALLDATANAALPAPEPLEAESTPVMLQ